MLIVEKYDLDMRKAPIFACSPFPRLLAAVSGQRNPARARALCAVPQFWNTSGGAVLAKLARERRRGD